jgi:hypothetical protein
MASKPKNTDGGYLGIPKRSCKVLPLSEKKKALHLGRKSYAKVARYSA